MDARAKGLDEATAGRLFRLLIGVFFSGGLLNSMVALLVPRLRITLGLDYAQALCVQLAYYSSYLLFALPITIATMRIGYLNGVAAGLGVTAIGCLAFTAALSGSSYGAVLASLLLMSAGVTFLQISGNAVTTAFGPGTRMAARFTLLQGFNAFGTVLGPLVGAWFLLGGGMAGVAPSAPFVAGAMGMALLAASFRRGRHLLGDARPAAPPLSRLGPLLATARMRGGVAAIFAYVGAEVAIGTLAVDYLMRPAVIGASPLAAGRLVSLYWGAAMLGRFAGAFVVRRVGAPRLLAAAATGAMLLTLAAILAGGWVGAGALLAIGLCNSVMFPLIYALALPEDEADVTLASMLLCMAVVGGAIVPVATGFAADAAGLAPSLLVPGLCYALILAFARFRRPDREPA